MASFVLSLRHYSLALGFFGSIARITHRAFPVYLLLIFFLLFEHRHSRRHRAHGDVLRGGCGVAAAAQWRLRDRGERGGAKARSGRATAAALRNGADSRAVPLLLPGARQIPEEISRFPV